MRVTELRKSARGIFDAAVRDVDPAEAIRRHVGREGDRLTIGRERVDLAGVGQIVVVGLGKAGAPMAAAVEEILGERIARGLVVTKYGHVQPTRTIRIHEAGHPVPDDAGMAGARALLDHVKGLSPGDLVLVLISGGGTVAAHRAARVNEVPTGRRSAGFQCRPKRRIRRLARLPAG